MTSKIFALFIIMFLALNSKAVFAYQELKISDFQSKIDFNLPQDTYINPDTDNNINTVHNNINSTDEIFLNNSNDIESDDVKDNLLKDSDSTDENSDN